MKKSKSFFLLMLLIPACTTAPAQENSGTAASGKWKTSQNKLLVKAFLGASFADPGSSFEYHNNSYTLSPEPGASGGLNFLFYSKNGIFITDRLALSYDRNKTEHGNLSFLVLSDYLNLGYAPLRFLSVEAGIGFNAPLYCFSSDSLFENTGVEGSPFVYDLALSLMLGRRTGIDVMYSVPFTKKNLWIYDKGINDLKSVNDYRPVIFSVSFTYQLSKVQRLLTGQKSYSIF